MKRAIRDAWVAALRSGKHTQGRYHLGRLDEGVLTECCLGVLCNINEIPHKSYGNRRLYLFRDEYTSTHTPPDDFHRLSYEVIAELINMNDNLAKSFSEIADWIEKNVGIEKD